MKKPRIKKMRNKELIRAIKKFREQEAKQIFRKCLLLLMYLNLPYIILPEALTSVQKMILVFFNLTIISLGLIIIYLYPLIISRRHYIELAFPYLCDDFHTLIRNAHLCCQQATHYKRYPLPSGIWGFMAKIELDQKIEELLFTARQNEEAAKSALKDVNLLKRTLDWKG
jgi:hypothetical protein